MTPKPGYEAIVAQLQRQLEMAEKELQRLWTERVMNPETMQEGPKNEHDIARVEAEIARIKADVAKHMQPPVSMRTMKIQRV